MTNKALFGWPLLLSLAFPLFITPIVWGDEAVDPSAIFDVSPIVQSSTSNTTVIDPGYDNQKSVTFSGQLNAFGGLLLNRNWLNGKGPESANQAFQFTEGNFMLDLRYQNGLKAFMNLSLLHSSSAVSTSNPYATALAVKELFVDYQINRQIYIRSGKQFVTWGRSYFWNPVDFVNRNKKDFLDLSALRSGVVGTRLDIPLGTDQNLYFFLDQDGVNTPKNFAAVAKADLTWNNVAIGLSIWSRYQAVTQYGIDWSTLILDWNVSSELALSQGSNSPRMVDSGGTLSVGSAPSEWQARSTLSLMRQWSWERPNRITSNLEFFYNGDGYATNVLSDTQKSIFLKTNNLITTNQLSAWYAACFLSISEFPTHDQSLALNGLLNAVDGSSIISTQLTHTFTADFNISFLVASISGGPDTEYGLPGDGIRIQGQTRLQF